MILLLWSYPTLTSTTIDAEHFPNILATKGTTIKIHDPIGLDASTQLNFYDSSRTLITAGNPTDENNDVFPETIEVTVPQHSGRLLLLWLQQ